MVLGTVPGDFILKEDKTPTSQQVRRGVLEFEIKKELPHDKGSSNW